MEWIRHTSWDEHMERAMALYHTSFPINEQRTDADHKAALENERFYCLSAWEGEEFPRSAVLLEDERIVLCRTFCSKYADARQWDRLPGCWRISVRISLWCCWKSTRRRTRFLKGGCVFYERLGFVQNPYPHRHPPYRRGFEAHPLRVMTWPRAASRQEYDGFFDELRNSVMQYAQK